jgi:hypothetical protein
MRRRFLVLLLVVAMSPVMIAGLFVDFIIIIPVLYVVRGGDVEFPITDFWFDIIGRISE